MGDDQFAAILVDAANRQSGAADVHRSERTPEQKRLAVGVLLDRFDGKAVNWYAKRADTSRAFVDKIIAERTGVVPPKTPVVQPSSETIAEPLRPIVPTVDAQRSLTERYRPVRLDDVVGQPDAVADLQAFIRSPYSTAFLLFGPTGTGKTASGIALADELGCDHDNPAGGFSQIPAGKQDGAAVDDLLRSLRHRPMFGSGWRVALINECDRMTPQAETRWLDGLESLPDRAVCVFTTNNPAKLSDRFVGRCEVVEYSGESSEFRSALTYRCRQVWHAETGVDDFRAVAGLGQLSARTVGPASLRVALKQVERQLRRHRSALAV